MAITSYKAVVGYYNSAGTPNITTAVTGQLADGWIPIGAPILTDAYGQCTQMMVKTDATPVVTVSAYTVVTAANPQPPDATWNAQGEPLWIDTTTYLQAYTKGGVVEENVRELWNRTLADAGLTLVAGSFEEGGTLTSSSQALLCYAYDQAYTWAGSFPKTVPVNSTPDSTGGISAGAWVSVSGITLRKELTSQGGAGIINGIARPVTWKGFAGGADPTGVNNSDAAFAAADTYDGDVFVPVGTYLISNTHRGNYSVDSDAKFTGGGVVLLKRRAMWATVDAPVNPTRHTRLFVGDTAYDYSGAKNATADLSSWLGKTDYLAPNGTPQPNLGWIEKNARFSSYASTGAIGLAGAAHNYEMPTGGAAIGVVGVGVNDNESGYTNNVWALYLDAKRYPNAMGTTWCAEMAMVNHGSYVDAHSSDNRGKTTCVSLVAGADPTINGTTEDCTQALAISSNGAKWGVGIIYPIGSLRQFTETGLTDPYQKAMVLRNTHRIGWEDGAGNSLSYVQSRVSSYAARMGMVFRDRAFDIEGNGLRALRLTYSAGDIGTIRLRTASEADPRIRIGAESIGNCSIALEASGSGTVTVNKPFTPATTNVFTCGTASLSWSGGFTQSAFIVTSDEHAKMEHVNITDTMLDAWSEVDFVQFQYVDRVEAKGVDGARWHFGVIAQRAKEAFERHGLDAHRFGFLCYDEWEDEWSRVQIGDSDEYENVLVNPAGSRYGIRYEEVLVLEAALQRRNYSRLLERVTALESK